jgi:hypothetical protein
LAASGSSVICEETANEVVGETMIASVVLVVTLSNFFAWQVFTDVIQVLLVITGLLVYGRVLVVKLKGAQERITVMVMGGETRAAAVEAKYRRVTRVLIGITVFLGAYVALAAVIDFDQWVRELVIGIGETAAMAAFEFVFWIRGSRKNDSGPNFVVEDIDTVPAVANTEATRPLLASSG